MLNFLKHVFDPDEKPAAQAVEKGGRTAASQQIIDVAPGQKSSHHESAWIEQAFRTELLEAYANARPKAILAQLTLLLIALSLTLLSDTDWHLPLGAALVSLCLFGTLYAADRTWSTVPLSRNAVWSWLFIAFETLQGTGWALLLNGFVEPVPMPVSTIGFFIEMALAGVALAFSSSLRGAIYGLMTPILIGVLVTLTTGADAIYQDTLILAVGMILFFFYLNNRIASATRDHLENRAEKDALIADLEQAKAHSDEARRRAEELNLAKSRFLATMSHELRTPLNAILGFSEVMESELLGQHVVPTYRDYAHDIHESGQLLLALIDEVLDLSRIEAGRYELVEKPMRLDDTVSDCAHLMQMRAKNRGISMMLMVDPHLAPINADERAMRQITLNLVSNAIKFTPRGGDVTIRVGKTPQGGQFIKVSDTGPGIPADEIPIILESFGRGSLAVKTAEQGSGLGLPIVRGLVTMHNGEFAIESREGQGTTVTILLPKERVLDTPPATRPVQRTAAAA